MRKVLIYSMMSATVSIHVRGFGAVLIYGVIVFLCHFFVLTKL